MSRLPTPIVRICEMTPEMKEDVIEFSLFAVETCTSDKEIATLIKEHFKANHGGTWHCIVGRNFGSFVTFE